MTGALCIGIGFMLATLSCLVVAAEDLDLVESLSILAFGLTSILGGFLAASRTVKGPPMTMDDETAGASVRDALRRSPESQPTEPQSAGIHRAAAEEAIERACRALYGERWTRMDKESPRRWMRDALTAAGTVDTHAVQYSGKLFEIGKFEDREATGIRVNCGGMTLELTGFTRDGLRALGPLWDKQVTITIGREGNHDDSNQADRP